MCVCADLQQFEFTCGSSSSNMWSPTTFSVPSGGSLTTPLRTDCGLCIQSAGGLSSRFDNATHCVGKDGSTFSMCDNCGNNTTV